MITSSDVHCCKLSECNEYPSKNERNNRSPSQIDALYQMESRSEKRENGLKNIGK